MKTFFKSILIVSFILSLSWACNDDGNEVIEEPDYTGLPQSDGGITPRIIEGEDENGDRSCEEVAAEFDLEAGFEFTSGQLNYVDGEFDNTWPGLTVTVTDDKYVEWIGSLMPDECLTNVVVIVKGSGGANVYFYSDGSLLSDRGLAPSIDDVSGEPFNLENVTFCWNVEPC
jgi:hypothetical protein